jgi:hypothetical protein
MAFGDHLQASRWWGYHHDGIDIGLGQVVHFAPEWGGAKSTATIRVDRLEDFARGCVVEVRRHPGVTVPSQTVTRALSQLGTGKYHLLFNNCEHFANWCVTGDYRSEQVDTAFQTIRTGGLAPAAWAAAEALISYLGAVTGLSGPGIMSGLATVGSVVGGGVMAGLVTLAALPGGAAVLLMRRTFRDEFGLADRERFARQLARIASWTGLGVALVGGVWLVGALGSVAGFSAAGITSGLAAIGGLLGGGMVVGALSVIAAPAAAAILLGAVVYVAARVWSSPIATPSPGGLV